MFEAIFGFVSAAVERKMGQLIAVVIITITLCTTSVADTTTPGSYEPAMRENVTFWIAVAGAIFGAIGTGLGAYNTVTSALARRINVKVIPRLSYPTVNGMMSTTGLHPVSVPLEETEISFEVINLSASAVTVDGVGFRLVGVKHRTAIRAQIRDSKPWPRRLETREAVEVFTGIRPTDPQLGPIHKAYVTLASGETFTGESPILRLIRGASLRDK